jgi:hypothetical protein
LPVLDSWNARCTVSPGTRPLAPTVSRFAAVPAVPSAITTVPDVMGRAADVVLVNEPNVPNPAIDAEAPSAATLRRTSLERDLREACRPLAMTLTSTFC